MAFLKFLIKTLIILAMVFVLVFPFALEFFTFKRDKKRGISHKRLRIIIYTFLYVIAVTVAMYLLKEFILWLETLSFVEWIANKAALSSRTVYFGKIVVAVLVNAAVVLLYRFIGKFVRIGLKKKNLAEPKKKDGEFSLGQKIERKIIRFFHKEAWFFVATVLKYLSILLSVAYVLVFVLYQIPALFGAAWIPYDFISMLFSAGYIYPAITLLALWESYFFLAGIKRVREECEDILRDEEDEKKSPAVDLRAIDEEVRNQFKDFYACDTDLSAAIMADINSTDHHPMTELIARAVERDERNPQMRRETYLKCVDKLVSSDKGVIINGNFFSEFSMYFLRYLSIIVARGDNIVFICNNDAQIDAVYDYLNRGLSEISSLYCKDFGYDAVDFDNPIWRLIKISGENSHIEEASVDENNILITSLGFLCSPRFETDHSKFISLIDAVVFVDSLNTVNKFNRQLAILNTRLKHITKKNAIAAKNGKPSDFFRTRYMSRQVRYICFADTRVSGLDKVLKTALGVDFDSIDAMQYNLGTIVRCYKFEGKADENGRRTCPQYLNSDEEIGALMNVAALCRIKGAKNVTVFTDDILPYANIAESLAANMGQTVIQADGKDIRTNKHFYNPDNYSVIVAMDSGDNLPATVRRYASMVSESPALIIIFSRPYMLRDYYLDNIDKLWGSIQLERIPVEEGTEKDIAQRIVVKANAGGISKKEVYDLCGKSKRFAPLAANDELDSILRIVLEIYGVTLKDRMGVFDYFEYTSSQVFDEKGIYNSEVKIVLRRKGKLFERVNGRDMVVMSTGDDDITLPMPKSRLTQNYIVGQNLVYNGNIYHIQKIDTAAGKLYTRLALHGKNDEIYQYIQDRDYRVYLAPDGVEPMFPTKHVVAKCEENGVSVSDVYVSVFRAPMEVFTNGYYDVDCHTLAKNTGDNRYHSINDPDNDELAKQTYRRYGVVVNPEFSSDSVLKKTDLNATEHGALMMSIRICGRFGADINKTASLAAAMLGELIYSMFPSVADSVAVCPVIYGDMSDADSENILRKQPGLTIVGEEGTSEKEFRLFIIEDCATDIGVVSVLMSSGDDVMKKLFGPIFSYLNWYFASDIKSDYLYYGLDHEPSCFDFASLHTLSKLLGDDKHDLKFVDIESIMEYEVCDFCGKRYPKGDDVVELDDGRIMCRHCTANLVGNNKKLLKSHLDRARIFLESTYGITLDDDYEFCFESTLKIVNTIKQNRAFRRRGTDAPLQSYVDDKKKVHVEYSVPSVNLSELLVRELTHVWQLKHLPALSEDLAEGHIALVAIQYLRFLGEKGLAATRTAYYESTDNASGEGYRRLVRELLANPQYNNNPFKYLLGDSGISDEDDVVPPPPGITDDEDNGTSYDPQQPDRVLDGNINYFYRSNLTATMQGVYDTMLNAIRNHEERIIVDNCSFEQLVKISESIEYDHPELFWYKTLSMRGTEVNLFYGASAEETALLQKKIDEIVPKYLEGIDDSMSAYDVAVRIHVKIISSVDYDTIALNRQKQEGGVAKDKIDYLRTICGVFINGKAVCEGYARALQYLLQKCGVECAEAAGYVRKENGEIDCGHAWNIVRIDGDYYYIDTTWDDSSNTIQDVKKNDLGFNYFCITTEELMRTRDLTLCPVEMPSCYAIKANYYYHNGLVIDSYDLNKIKAFAEAAAENKRADFTFKCKTRAVYDTALNQLCIQGGDCFEVIKAAAKHNKQINTSSYSYTYDKNIWTITVKFKFK